MILLPHEAESRNIPLVTSGGMVAGLIHDIPTCKELIDRILTGAEALIRGRLEAMPAAG